MIRCVLLLVGFIPMLHVTLNFSLPNKMPSNKTVMELDSGRTKGFVEKSDYIHPCHHAPDLPLPLTLCDLLSPLLRFLIYKGIGYHCRF